GGTVVAGSNPRQMHGVVYWDGGNSAINANPYILAGQPLANPSYSSNSYGATVAGHPYIPHLTKPSQRDTLSLSFAGQSSRQLVNDYGVVPTELERQGNFSQVKNSAGEPLRLFVPGTFKLYPNSIINTPL